MAMGAKEKVMKITIKNFESKINPIILERGKDYFQNGQVKDLEELSHDFWSANVKGTETYEVKIKIKDAEIIEWTCNCPYDLGSICKHQVATIFAIKESCFGEKISDPIKKKPKTKKTERKTVEDKIKEILDDISPDEIKEIASEFAFENIEFRNKIFTHFALKKDIGSDKNLYKQIIEESLCQGMNYHGFIDYNGSSRAVRGINELLTKADQMLEKGQTEQAILIYQTAIEETFPTLQCADDSNGNLSDVINWSFEKLHECIPKIKNETTRKNLLNYCLLESASKIYEDWSSWRWELIDIASRLIVKEEMATIFSKIDELLEKEQDRENFSYKYNKEKSSEVKLEIIERFKGPTEALKFINENLEFTPIRQAAIEYAIDEKNYIRAKNLAKEGIELDTERGWPGLVVRWKEFLYKIANKEKDIDEIRKYTKELFFEGKGFEYYKKLKNTYSAKEWKKELLDFLNQLKKARVGYYTTFGEIYIEEEKWDDLLNLIKEHVSIQTIETYQKYLEKYFPDELVVLYESAIRKMLEQTIGRGSYQEVCRILRRLRKLGAFEKVQSLINEFKGTYKNRKALLEELDLV